MMLKAFILTLVLCVVAMVFSSSLFIRIVATKPLVLHDQQAKADSCYVLAGGGAIWERLDAASDLVQMGRVSKIMLMQDTMVGQYSFKAQKSWTKSQWMADYLAWRGITPQQIQWLPQAKGFLGTLTEAKAVADQLPKDCKSLIVISSAPHMRRSVLAFSRVLAKGVTVIPYAATTTENSYELHHPIWLEYLKLLVYSVIA